MTPGMLRQLGERPSAISSGGCASELWAQKACVQENIRLPQGAEDTHGKTSPSRSSIPSVSPLSCGIHTIYLEVYN